MLLLDAANDCPWDIVGMIREVQEELPLEGVFTRNFVLNLIKIS